MKVDVAEFVEHVLGDPALVEHSLSAMRDHLVRAGDFRSLGSHEADIYPYATPFVMGAGLWAQLRSWTERIVAALEKEAQALREVPDEANSTLCFASSLDHDLFFNGYTTTDTLPIHRLDFALDRDGNARLLEVNCGCPGGELDPALVAEAFIASQLYRRLEALVGGSLAPYPDPREESLGILLRCYHAFRKARPGLPERPTIALITTSAQAQSMIPECRGIARYYQSRGFRALVGDLLELEVLHGEVRLRGERVDLIFRKFATNSFKRRLIDSHAFTQDVRRRVRALWEAICNGLVCMVNPLGSTFLQDKGLLETLRIRHPSLRALIPETYVLAEDLPSRERSLWKAICAGEQFIVKKRHSFGGRHVVLDPQRIRSMALEIIREEPGQWVAQQRVAAASYPFAVEDHGQIRVARFPYTVSLFGRSNFVRVGTGGPYDPINAQGRGAATCGLSLLPRCRQR